MPAFFFEPLQLSGEFADFRVQLRRLLLMILLQGCSTVLSPVLEQAEHVIHSHLLPPVEHGRMNAVFRSNLVDGFLFLEQLEYDLRFK